MYGDVWSEVVKQMPIDPLFGKQVHDNLRISGSFFNDR